MLINSSLNFKYKLFQKYLNREINIELFQIIKLIFFIFYWLLSILFVCIIQNHIKILRQMLLRIFKFLFLLRCGDWEHIANYDNAVITML